MLTERADAHSNGDATRVMGAGVGGSGGGARCGGLSRGAAGCCCAGAEGCCCAGHAACSRGRALRCCDAVLLLPHVRCVPSTGASHAAERRPWWQRTGRLCTPAAVRCGTAAAAVAACRCPRRAAASQSRMAPTATLHSLGASDQVPLTQSASQDFPRSPSAGARPTPPRPCRRHRPDAASLAGHGPLRRSSSPPGPWHANGAFQGCHPAACRRRQRHRTLLKAATCSQEFRAPGCPLPLPPADHAARPAVRLRRAAAGHQVRGVSPRFCRRVLPGDGAVRGCSAARAAVAESLRCCSQHCLGPSPTQFSYAAVKSWSCITRSITRQAGGREEVRGWGRACRRR